MSTKGTFYLLPNLLGKGASPEDSFPSSLFSIVPKLSGMICESEKGGRSFLSIFHDKPVHQIPLSVVNKSTPKKDLDFYLEPLLEGESWGYVPDAGLPCLADPGSLLVARARQLKIPVEVVVGPSSIFLALLLSGLPAQRFMFHGYLPQDKTKKRKEITKLEKLSKTYRSTQVFIEAPYRNEGLLDDLLFSLDKDTLLAVVESIHMPEEKVYVYTVEKWKERTNVCLNKKPAVFIFFSKSW